MIRRLAIAFLAVLLPALAAAQETPDALVKRTTDEVLGIIRADKDIRRATCARSSARRAEDPAAFRLRSA